MTTDANCKFTGHFSLSTPDKTRSRTTDVPQSFLSADSPVDGIGGCESYMGQSDARRSHQRNGGAKSGSIGKRVKSRFVRNEVLVVENDVEK